MNNILIDSLPETITVGGRDYQADTDFRTALRIMLAFEDPELVGIEKQTVLITNLFIEYPSDVTGAFAAGLNFLNMDQPANDEEEGPRVYSFSKDANLIFAAFRQTHGIDLAEVPYMHWWKFMTLFMDLGADTAFCNLVSLRKRVKMGRASKEERQAAKEMGSMFDIPELDDRTLEEKEREAEFLRLVKR